MTPAQLEAQARTRYFTMSFLRFIGAACVAAGIVIASDRFEGIPAAIGYVLIAIGLIDMTLLPRILARRWRTPPPA